MRSIVIRVFGMLVQILLVALAIHMANALIARLFEARIRSLTRRPKTEFLPLPAELPVPRATT
jgi:hypothetical protein